MTERDALLSNLAFGIIVPDAADESQSAFYRFVERFGGATFVCRTVNDEPTQANAIRDYSSQLITGGIDVSVFMTSAGAKRILDVAFRSIGKQRVVDSLNDTMTLAANQRIFDVMQEHKVEPTITLGLASTPAIGSSWREVLTSLDRHFHSGGTVGFPGLANLNVALEATSAIHSLAAGFEARGSNVLRVPAFADNSTMPSPEFESLFATIETGGLDAITFNSPDSVVEFFAQAKQLRSNRWREHTLFELLVIGFDIDVEEILNDHGVSNVWIVTEDDMEQTPYETAKKISNAMNQKQQSVSQLSGPSSSSVDENAPWYNSPFMKACRCEPTDVTPIWMMRQAGRYMAEYREVRAKVSFLELCANPQLCSEVMCTAVGRLGVDAAIIFSDLLPILVPMGCDLEFVKGDGPVIHNPVRAIADIDRIKPLESNEPLQFVMDTVTQTRSDLPADMPLIGFAGSPFTLASYMIEGGSSRNYANTKALMYSDHGAWKQLMDHLVSSISLYLNGQIRAGAQCVQLFDSWAGCLSFDDYRQFELPYVKAIINSLPPGVPVINFATGNPALLPHLADTSASVIGIDWRVRLDDAWQTVGYDRAVQGNLDPTVLLTNPTEIRRQAKVVLDQVAKRPGHIFNLGHGILPQTPVDNAIALVDAVHELSSK